jgi:hypothetical protein
MSAPIQFIVLKRGKEGKPGVVLLQKSKTKFEKIWTYGESPYPPARSDTQEAAKLGNDALRRLSNEVEHRPLVTLAVAVGVGILVGILVGLTSRSVAAGAQRAATSPPRHREA